MDATASAPTSQKSMGASGEADQARQEQFSSSASASASASHSAALPPVAVQSIAAEIETSEENEEPERDIAGRYVASLEDDQGQEAAISHGTLAVASGQALAPHSIRQASSGANDTSSDAVGAELVAGALEVESIPVISTEAQEIPPAYTVFDSFEYHANRIQGVLVSHAARISNVETSQEQNATNNDTLRGRVDSHAQAIESLQSFTVEAYSQAKLASMLQGERIARLEWQVWLYSRIALVAMVILAGVLLRQSAQIKDLHALQARSAFAGFVQSYGSTLGNALSNCVRSSFDVFVLLRNSVSGVHGTLATISLPQVSANSSAISANSSASTNASSSFLEGLLGLWKLPSANAKQGVSVSLPAAGDP
ncbi:hypothetical protein CBOM_01243 [Ceraceosorus bombacis]|uniref:Uncharacterized protein n=1 Tax=Ceraceosorus bombacis TaxID=401625 RepID=A0A0P1BD84_9BASI|nr:hypothetical protein CBOM_01243 [Ceraceosorus bombacis]